jgi:hypothetical protein
MLMTRLWLGLLGAVQVVQPEMIMRWHRVGFRMFGQGGRGLTEACVI